VRDMGRSPRHRDTSVAQVQHEASEWEGGDMPKTVEARQASGADAQVSGNSRQNGGGVGEMLAVTGQQAGTRCLNSPPQQMHVHIHSYDPAGSPQRCVDGCMALPLLVMRDTAS
jgi:hypothetical protein